MLRIIQAVIFGVTSIGANQDSLITRRELRERTLVVLIMNRRYGEFLQGMPQTGGTRLAQPQSKNLILCIECRHVNPSSRFLGLGSKVEYDKSLVP